MSISRPASFPVLLLATSLLAACGSETAEHPAPVPGEPPVSGARESGAAPAAGDEAPWRIVFLGDSLTAGYGLPEEEAFPAVVAERLAEQGRSVEVVNAGVSGDTSAGGLARLDWVLGREPDIVVVELGPNDGLRGLSLEMTERNLRQIITRAREAGARVLLVGMKLPPNYGPDYTARFEALYPRLAQELDVPLVPFLLEGVGGEPELNLPDGMHPNPAGHRRVAENVLPYLREVLEALDGTASGG